jgi:hypothetical protein
MRSLAASLIALTALAACEQPSPPSETTFDRAAAAKRAEPQASRSFTEVRWPAPDRLDRAALTALPKAAAHAVRVSRVPVLIPPAGELLAAPVVVARDDWTSFWARTPDITVSLMMTRLAHRYGKIPPMRGPHKVRGLPAFVTENEGIRSATWLENGVSYTLDIECASPGAPACASEAWLLSLAQQLVYVGGAGAAQEGAP